MSSLVWAGELQEQWVLSGGGAARSEDRRGTAHFVLNTVHQNYLVFGDRTTGVELTWSSEVHRSPYGSLDAIHLQTNRTFTPQATGDRRSLRYGERLALWSQGAIARKGRGYLRHEVRDWGINLVWAVRPSYEWVVTGGEAGRPVRDPTSADPSRPVGLMNVMTGEHLIYCEREWGINLRWQKDCEAPSRPPTESPPRPAGQGLDPSADGRATEVVPARRGRSAPDVTSLGAPTAPRSPSGAASYTCDETAGTCVCRAGVGDFDCKAMLDSFDCAPVENQPPWNGESDARSRGLSHWDYLECDAVTGYCTCKMRTRVQPVGPSRPEAVSPASEAAADGAGDRAARSSRCAAASVRLCRRHGASCDVVSKAGGGARDLCRWPSVTTPEECSDSGGIWTPARSRYASNHRGAVPAGEAAACVTEVDNLGR